MQNTEKNKTMAETQIENLQQQKQKLTSDINNLNTDQGKEEVFRENFGLAKAGESEIVVLDDNTPHSATPYTHRLLGIFKEFFK